MNRRNFVKQQLAVSAVEALGTLGMYAGSSTRKDSFKKQQAGFNLKYAPHLGMFRHHAGDDPLDQLKFMADQGFTAFEDNGMKHRDNSLQEKMARTMQQLDKEMGVF